MTHQLKTEKKIETRNGASLSSWSERERERKKIEKSENAPTTKKEGVKCFPLFHLSFFSLTLSLFLSLYEEALENDSDMHVF